MQEKSNTETQHRQTALDSFVDNIRKYDDWIVSVGVVAAIMILFKLVCVISMSL